MCAARLLTCKSYPVNAVPPLAGAPLRIGAMASGSVREADLEATTEAAAEYLMTIRYMHGEGQPVIAARLAERLHVTPATVSEMVNRLTRAGLLTVDEGTRELLLTDRGRRAAERTFRRHALAEWLLTEVIGLGWAEADEEAHHLQHALSDRVTDRIDELLGHPPTCPHGNPLPRDGRTPDRPAGIRLSDAVPGSDVTVLRVTEEAEEDARLLTFLEQHGVRPGRLLRVVEVAEHIGTMTLSGDGGDVTIGLVAAAKIRALEGRADPALFHRVPERARLAASAAR
ncbi:MAG TPA: metal-dependent transcriptional regulator [Candidatus Limnocylindria bacterium]|nr:metal-dependent transcriptional regulator [Candidatus Limnocylindria bacterium]